MKIVRLGMTESSTFLLWYVLKYGKEDEVTKNRIVSLLLQLTNWLYTTSGFYDKTVMGTHFDFDASSMRSPQYQLFLSHLEQAVNGCKETQFFFHDGFIMGLFHKYKKSFAQTYNIINPVVLNGTRFQDRIQDICSLLTNKKVLVISCFDKLIQSQYNSGNMKKIYDFFPSILSLDTVSFPYCFCNNGPDQNYSETLEKVFERIKNKEFDIALLGCGAYGHMLTHKIHELHKDAYYIGGSITNLFGILTTREATTNIVTNEHWITKIPDEYKPSNYMMIENGCYW